jgi:molecular chaperone DnaK
MTAAVGIDLGTTNTAVAVVVDGVATTIEDSHGRRLIPSVVAFESGGTTLVGEMAKERRVSDPKNTVYSVKRLIGRAWGSPEVSEAERIFPFSLKEGPKQSVLVDVHGASYGLPEVSAFVLRRAKQIAEQALGEAVDRAVITVPANFNELQRASTKVAGRLAGLEILRVLNEPTAAALAYGQAISGASRVAVFDLGGGTFDITVLDLSKDVFEVLSTSGDMSLGGDDFDACVAVHLAELCAKTGYDPRGKPEEFARLKLIAESIKIELSTEREFNRTLTVTDPSSGKVHNVDVYMTRTMLEKLVSPLVDRTLEVTKRSLMSAGLSARDIDQVILVGGSTRMPVVGASVATLFGKQPTSRINPDEVVALGAAIQAFALNKDRAKRPNVVLTKKGPAPVVPPARARAATIVDGALAGPAVVHALDGRHSSQPNPNKTLALGAMAIQKSPASPSVPEALPTERVALSDVPPTLPQLDMAIPRRAPTLSFEIEGDSQPPPAPDFMPLGSSANALPSQAKTAAHADKSSSFQFDFASLGSPTSNSASSTRQPEARARELKTSEDGSVATRSRSPLLIDVTPLSLRVETVGGYSDVLLSANTPVPCERTRVFMTAHDMQTSVRVRVAQGEFTPFAQNTALGELELSGIRAAGRGDVKVLVTFELDADGTLKVSAREDGTQVIAKAVMHLTGAQQESQEVEAMMARQQARNVTG